MKANTVVVISGRVCAPTVEYPEPSVLHEKQMAKFLSSCVPFEDQALSKWRLANIAILDVHGNLFLSDNPIIDEHGYLLIRQENQTENVFLLGQVAGGGDIIKRKYLFDEEAMLFLKENHPYPVDEYEFEVKKIGCGDDRCVYLPDEVCQEKCNGFKQVAVLVDEKKEEKPDFKKLFEDSSLFNKHLKQQTTERGPIWVDDKGNEWVKKEQESQEELWGKALLIADMAQFRINHDGSNQIKQLTQ